MIFICMKIWADSLSQSNVASWILMSLLVFCSLHVQASEDTEPRRLVPGPHASHLVFGPGMDATGGVLKGSVIVGVNLRGAVFDGCDLDGVLFYQCDLSDASFKRAILTGMNITDCKVESANFTDAIINGIVGMSGGLTDPPENRWPHDMHLSEKQLKSTYSYKTRNLRKCVISEPDRTGTGPPPPKYDFRNAHLEGAVLSNIILYECDFSGAYIDRITIQTSGISFAQLASTDNFKNRRVLHGVSFSNIASKGHWDFSRMDLAGTRQFPLQEGFHIDFTDANITDCTFDGDLCQTQLRSTSNFKTGRLCQIRFVNFDFSGFDFSRTNLSGSTFLGCSFADAEFDDAVITDIRFSEHLPPEEFAVDYPEPKGLTLDQIKSTWNYKNGRMEGIELPKEIAEALQREKGQKTATPSD